MRYRQALASPHSAIVHDTSSAPFIKGTKGTHPLEDLMKFVARGFAALSLALALSACAGALRNPDIGDVKQNAGHYSDRTVTVDGTVTSSWGVPLVPFKMYKVDDGTGEITVLARGGNRTPSKGSRVKVKGVVRDVAMFNGMPLGLHLEERDLDIRR